MWFDYGYENMTLCVCVCVHVRARTVHSFHAPLAQAVLQTLIVHPPLCSNDYWLLIDSFMRCELLWLVSYRGVHMKIWSVWFMSSFWFYWGAQWTAAASENKGKQHISSFQSKSLYFCLFHCQYYWIRFKFLSAVMVFFFKYLSKWFCCNDHNN